MRTFNNQLNVCFTSVTEGEVWPVKHIKASPVNRYSPFQAGGADVIFTQVSVLVSELRCCFALFLFIILFVLFGLLSVQPFGKQLLTRLAICSHYLLSICIFSFISHFGF